MAAGDPRQCGMRFAQAPGMRAACGGCAALGLVLAIVLQTVAQDVSTPVPPRLTAAEMLEKFGVDASQQAALFEGQGLAPSEEDVVVKILYNLPRLGRANLFAWSQSSGSMADLVAAPRERHLQVFPLRGRAKRAVRRALLPEQAELYEFQHYYHVQVELADSPNHAFIVARHVPAAWPLDEPLDEPITAAALFLKTGETSENSPALYFAADRVGWLPEKINAALGVSAADLSLAQAGFDIGLWEEVRQSPDHALTITDREPFYQLLAALARKKKVPGQTPVSAPLDVVKLLANPREFQGEVFSLTGVARRITRVAVGDADVRARFGVDHYFEIDLFLPLQGPSLRLSKPGQPTEGPRFENEFPATLLVAELPPDLAASDNVHLSITADAVFFKVWAYRSSYTAQFGQLQPSPLFIAHQPRLVAIKPPSNWLAGTLVVVALAIALVAVPLMLWSQRHSRLQHRRKFAPTIQIPHPNSEN